MGMARGGWAYLKGLWGGRCRLLGHKFDTMDSLMFEIECSALNADELDPRISCVRCGNVFRMKQGKEAK